MPRRSLDRKKVPAPDERTAARYLLELPGDRLYREPLAFPRLSSASLFGNEKPLELQIGCGNGEFLCSLARRDHETNFVGVEVKRTAVHEAAPIHCHGGSVDRLSRGVRLGQGSASVRGTRLRAPGAS